MTNIYMAGSISHSPDDGRGWRNELQDSRENVNFLSPLDEHDPRTGDYERSDIVPDDLSLLDRIDGMIVKYEHGTNCWGTPSEQGYALCVNRRTDDDLLVVVWWDELGEPMIPFMEPMWLEDDASPWLTDPNCTIGVHSDRDTALNELLDEIRSLPTDVLNRLKTALKTPTDSHPHTLIPCLSTGAWYENE